MQHLRRARAPRLLSLLSIALMLFACASSELPSEAPSYSADDIDINGGTLKGRKLSEMVDVRVQLSGLAKTTYGKRPVMYLTHDISKFDDEVLKNCIHLIIDNKLNFNSPRLREHTFIGHFILLDRADSTVVYMTHNGIRFDTDCQAFEKVDQYPYFVVEGFGRK